MSKTREKNFLIALRRKDLTMFDYFNLRYFLLRSARIRFFFFEKEFWRFDSIRYLSSEIRYDMSWVKISLFPIISKKVSCRTALSLSIRGDLIQSFTNDVIFFPIERILTDWPAI